VNNYHTHTYRCKHASGDVPDYVEHARRAGLRELGFSDHVPFPDGLWGESRMDHSESLPYVRSIAEARAAEAARPDGLRILAGFECEWREDMEGYLRDLSPSLGLDYLVGGVHWIPVDGDWLSTTRITRPLELRAFADYTVRTIRSGLFSFLAHPDVFCARWHRWDAEAAACSRAIIEAAVDEGLSLEINGYGLRKPYVSSADGYRPQYPFDRFWELAAEYRATVIVNSDAHRPRDVGASLGEAREIAARWGLSVAEELSGAKAGRRDPA
jgi:histidinol-phosphatase (PHP family)